MGREAPGRAGHVGSRRDSGVFRLGGAAGRARRTDAQRVGVATAEVVAGSVALLFVLFLGCAPAARSPGPRDPSAPAPAPPFEWRLPPGFPVPKVPADNPMTSAK